MTPIIESGQKVTVSPGVSDVKVGDAVFCKVRGNYYVHLVKQIDDKGRYLIGNNKGGTNGWTTKIFGKVVKVET